MACLNQQLVQVALALVVVVEVAQLLDGPAKAKVGHYKVSTSGTSRTPANGIIQHLKINNYKSSNRKPVGYACR